MNTKRTYSDDFNNFIEMVETRSFLILDTETTGLGNGEICQIAIIDASGAVHFESLIKPTRPIPPDATAIHGITDAMVADSPTFKDVIPEIKVLLEDIDLIVWNAIYDRKMMHTSAEAHSLEKVAWKEIARWHCAMEAFAEFYGDWNEYYKSYRWQKLTTAARYFRISVVGAHSALVDAQMTRSVVMKMAEEVKEGAQDG